MQWILINLDVISKEKSFIEKWEIAQENYGVWKEI